MPPRSLPPITTGGEAYIDRVVNVLCVAFSINELSLNRAFIRASHKLPNDSEISSEHWRQHFLPSTRKKVEAGAILVEAGEWGGVAVWFPPGVAKPSLDPSTLSPLMADYFAKTDVIKKQHLGTRQHWYLNLIGRDPERKEPGVIRALFDPYLKQAQEAGLLTWLEATNEHARDVYAHFGFKVVGESVIGTGMIDEKGLIVPGGKGVRIYSMLREPEI